MYILVLNWKVTGDAGCWGVCANSKLKASMSLRASLLEIRISYKFSLFHFFFKNNISHLQKYLISHLQKASRNSFALEVFGSICVKREFVSCLEFKSYLKVIINGVFMQIRITTCVQKVGNMKNYIRFILDYN